MIAECLVLLLTGVSYTTATSADWKALDYTEFPKASHVYGSNTQDLTLKTFGPARRVSEPHTLFLTTAANHKPCDYAALGQYISMLSMKNKQDYARVHNYGFNWKMELVDEQLPGPWNKIAILRQLLGTLDPEQFEWVLWVDYDTLLDMNFTLPYERYAGKDLVLWHEHMDKMMAGEADSMHLNSGVILIRNTDWSRQFLDEVALFGLQWWNRTWYNPKRAAAEEAVGHFSEGLYEQNIIPYVLQQNPQWRTKVFGEGFDQDYYFHAHYEYTRYTPDIHVLVMHYAGCQYCQPKWNKRHDVRGCVFKFLDRYTQGNKIAMERLGEGDPFPLEDERSLLRAKVDVMLTDAMLESDCNEARTGVGRPLNDKEDIEVARRRQQQLQQRHRHLSDG